MTESGVVSAELFSSVRGWGGARRWDACPAGTRPGWTLDTILGKVAMIKVYSSPQNWTHPVTLHLNENKSLPSGGKCGLPQACTT